MKANVWAGRNKVEVTTVGAGTQPDPLPQAVTQS
jgi:hypothetical protein